jgi:TM2 domain-containing membrane protein YozV
MLKIQLMLSSSDVVTYEKVSRGSGKTCIRLGAKGIFHKYIFEIVLLLRSLLLSLIIVHLGYGSGRFRLLLVTSPWDDVTLG